MIKCLIEDSNCTIKISSIGSYYIESGGHLTISENITKEHFLVLYKSFSDYGTLITLAFDYTASKFT